MVLAICAQVHSTNRVLEKDDGHNVVHDDGHENTEKCVGLRSDVDTS